MLEKNKTIVIKIGTTSITKDGEMGINRFVLGQLATKAVELKKKNYKVAIVSSGAMGLGVAKLGKDFVDEKITKSQDCDDNVTCYKQALTSVGQIELMNAYEEAFQNQNMHIGQVLITHKGLDDTERNTTIKNTLERIFELDLVPIVNANDTVSSVEISYSDNDSLAARVAVLLEAEKLIILSDVDGLYNKDPNKNDDAELLEEVFEITEEIKNLAKESSTEVGMGGMKSKILAIETCMASGINAEIINTRYLEKLFDEGVKKTKFVSS